MPSHDSQKAVDIARRDTKESRSLSRRSVKSQPNKFRRVSRACNRCRGRKGKCDGKDPTCSNCSLANERCSYPPDTRKRGLPSGYVRVLEMLWGTVLSTIPGSEEAVTTLTERISCSGTDWRLSMLEKWKASTLLKEVERLLLDVEVLEKRATSHEKAGVQQSRETVADQLPAFETTPDPWRLEDLESAYEDSSLHCTKTVAERAEATSAAYDTPQRGLPPLSMSNKVHDASVATMDLPNTAETMPDSRRSQHETDYESGTGNPSLPADVWELFDIYFVYTHCWFPIIDKADILKAAYSYSYQSVHITGDSPGSGTHAALWAILALATHQYSARKGQSPSLHPSTELQWSDGQLYNIARDLIPSEGSNYELGHVQALLLLSLIKYGAGSWSAAWLLIGQAVCIAVDIGLDHSPQLLNDCTTASGSRRKQTHVFLGCFILDTLISARLGRPPHLRKEAITDVGRVREEGIEEWSPWVTSPRFEGLHCRKVSQNQPMHGESTFNQLLALASILSSFTSEGSNAFIPLERYHDILELLQEWSKALPRQCQLPKHINNILMASICPLPQVLILHLLYATALAILQIRASVANPSPTRSAGNSEETHGSLSSHMLYLFRCYSETYSTVTISPVLEIAATFAGRHAAAFEDPSNKDEEDDASVQDSLAIIAPQLKRVWSGTEKSPNEVPALILRPEKLLRDRVSGSIATPTLPAQQPPERGGAFPHPHVASIMQLGSQSWSSEFDLRCAPESIQKESLRRESHLDLSSSDAIYGQLPNMDLPSFSESPRVSDLPDSLLKPQFALTGQVTPMDDMDWAYNEILGLDCPEM
jgi:hypothetical protein